jgi:two-component system sensor histidine kinase RpfC
LRARRDSEHEQAVLRIAIVGVVLAFMAIMHPQETVLLWVLAVDLLFAIAVFTAVVVWPAENVPRRLLGSLADNATATAVLFLAEEAGTAMLGVYLFVSFGNGFRYGRRYLFISQALAILGFTGVLLFDDHWARHQTAGWCLMAALIVLPLYVSTLLRRVHDAQHRAEEANKAKSTFLANMSHEMRTPLSGIAGVTDLLQNTRLDLHQEELVRLLRHSVVLLRSLIDDVLDITKIEAGHLNVEIVDFDLYATVNSLATLMRQHAIAKDLKLYAMIDPNIDYHLRGDPHHLRQVLLNLLSNAVKFTEHGTIDMLVKLVSETSDGMRIRFEVRDTGIGIAQEVQQRIFERFVQADSSTTRRYGGTGLGTTIAKQLVELMGGQIGVESTPGVGSTFWFELPLLKASTRVEVPRAQANAAILLADEDAAHTVLPVLAAVCGRVERVSTGASVVSTLSSLKAEGYAVAAIFASGDVSRARDAFEQVARSANDAGTAMIYLATAAVEKEGARLAGIDGAIALKEQEASPRVLLNAIHAATTRGTSSGAQVIELADVLKQSRLPLRILVAEDNETNRTIITRLLESAGHAVLPANDGEGALDVFSEGEPELAILDFNMPLRNGIEVTTAIRTMEPTGTRMPIILFSATVTPESRQLALSAGADEFVGKPFEAAALLQTIDRLARRASRGIAPAKSRAGKAAAVSELELPLIDHRRLAAVEEIAPDDEFFAMLLRGFQSDVEKLVLQLDEGVGARIGMRIADAAHGIRGAAVGIGARRLAACAEGIEAAATAGDFSRVERLVATLPQILELTGQQLSAYAMREHRVSL